MTRKGMVGGSDGETVEAPTSAPSVSFEFFPPATPEMAYRLWSSATVLGALGPKFVSVTYGAGGATRRRTLDAIAALRQNARMPVAGHLTCVGDDKASVLEVARSYRRLGVKQVVALRGDPPKGADRFEPHPGGFRSSVELIEALRRDGGLSPIVGCYPEKHPEAASLEADIAWLKRKQDAGAELAITQFFFENDAFLAYRDACVAAGVTMPIVPGLLPIENFQKMAGFAARCGARVPQWLRDLFEQVDARPEAERADAGALLAKSLCAEQAADLVGRGGCGHLHFYTLNTPSLTYDVCRALGVEAGPVALAAAG